MCLFELNSFACVCLQQFNRAKHKYYEISMLKCSLPNYYNVLKYIVLFLCLKIAQKVFVICACWTAVHRNGSKTKHFNKCRFYLSSWSSSWLVDSCTVNELPAILVSSYWLFQWNFVVCYLALVKYFSTYLPTLSHPPPSSQSCFHLSILETQLWRKPV